MLIGESSYADALKLLLKAAGNKHHVGVLYSNCIDSICTCSIITQLLESHQVPYSTIFVQSFKELQTKIPTLTFCSHFCLLNTGGSERLNKVFRDPSRLVFVFENSRPINLVSLFTPHIIVFDDFFSFNTAAAAFQGSIQADYNRTKLESSSVEASLQECGEDSEDEDEFDTTNAFPLTPMAVHELSANIFPPAGFEDEDPSYPLSHNRLRFSLEFQNNYYTPLRLHIPSCVIAYRISVNLGLVNISMFFAMLTSIYGLLIEERIDKDTVLSLQRFLTGDQSQFNFSTSSEIVPLLPMLKSWTLWEAMHASPVVFTKLRLYSEEGMPVLRRFLSQAGLGLKNSKRTYTSTTMAFKHQILQVFDPETTFVDSRNGRLSNNLLRSFDLQDDINFPVWKLNVSDRTNSNFIDFALNLLVHSNVQEFSECFRLLKQMKVKTEDFELVKQFFTFLNRHVSHIMSSKSYHPTSTLITLTLPTTLESERLRTHFFARHVGIRLMSIYREMRATGKVVLVFTPLEDPKDAFLFTVVDVSNGFFKQPTNSQLGVLIQEALFTSNVRHDFTSFDYMSGIIYSSEAAKFFGHKLGYLLFSHVENYFSLTHSNRTIVDSDDESDDELNVEPTYTTQQLDMGEVGGEDIHDMLDELIENDSIL
ncbi:hypothetical protein PCE1_000833 [Barthelona sp. PCE]